MQWNEDIEKGLALMMERDGLEWFSTGDGEDVRIWEGDETEAKAKWDDYCHECEDDEKDPNTFEQWVEDEFDDKEVEVEEYDEYGDWKVYTDSEADDAWDECLDNYIEECLEIPANIRNYFDEEAWKKDARMDGRGHSLSGYDGNECEQEVNGTTYYLYRQN